MTFTTSLDWPNHDHGAAVWPRVRRSRLAPGHGEKPRRHRTAATAAKPSPPHRSRPPTLPADESARYAEREQQSKSLEQFKGGEGISIYMGSTVLAIMLVLVVLLVLL